jgi:RNA-directed DNA polymerase
MTVLWESIASFESLHSAYIKARKGKRFETDPLRFGLNLEAELFRILDELKMGTYRTGRYQRFFVYEPKLREVAALAFRDRVVQHALVAAIEPVFEKEFIYDSYACRVSNGTHAGADRLTSFLRRAHRNLPVIYILKADISKYFASIDHGILFSLIKKRITCQKTMYLISDIINSWNMESGIGLPIGNLTSQLFANIYLHELDLFAKHNLRSKFYIRYMDDFILLGSDKNELNHIRYLIEQFLGEHLHLTFNNRTSIYCEAQGVDFLGYRIWRTHRLLRKNSVLRMKRKLRLFSKRYSRGDIEEEKIQASIGSWLGHAKHACTYNLRVKMFQDFVLRRQSV